MGCGSLSTAAVYTGDLAKKPNMGPPSVNLTVRSNTLSPWSSSSLKSSLRNRESTASRFKVSIKEIDVDKHKDDHGGVWLGSEQDSTDATPNLTLNLEKQDSLKEEKSIVKDSSAVDNLDNDSSQYATISYGSPSKSHVKQDKADEMRVPEPEQFNTMFRKISPKQRHLHDSLLYFRSVEDGFSYNYEHCDVEKQMSDSELDDHISHFVSERTCEEAVTQRTAESKETSLGNTGFNPDPDLVRSSLLSGSQGDHNWSSPSAPDVKEEKKVKEAQKKYKKRDKSSGNSASGVSLEDFPTSLENPFVPQFVYKCVSYIEAVGLKTEGLYRISGNKAQGELFVNQFSADPNIDVSTLEIPVNAVATLLKSFFSDLSEALIPANLCGELMETAEVTSKSSRLLMLRGIIKKLTTLNFEVLKYLITHLSKVAQHQEFNNMSSRNLAKCWWPTLMRLQFKTYEKLIQGSQIPEDIVQTLIEQCSFIFHGGIEV